MSHYYQLLDDGTVEPRHFVPMAKDPSRSRGTRISDVRKWLKEGKKVYPSVTTILQMLDKPALSEWRINQHLQTVWEQGNLGANSFEEFLYDVKKITQERLDLAPKAGTDIHKVLEDYFAKGIVPKDDTEQTICFEVETKLAARGIRITECEKYFAETTHGYAGCADVVAMDKDGNRFIIDYKSKQTSDAFNKAKLYQEHFRQLGAYGNAIFKEKFKAAIIFIDLESGCISYHECSESQLELGYQDFIDCLSIWNRNML